MHIRQRVLPPGWYPSSENEVIETLQKWDSRLPEAEHNCVACIVPHAGWFFSGELAFQAIRALNNQAETVVVIGGHMPEMGGVRIAEEEGYETPLGVVEADRELVQKLGEYCTFKPDREPDNTVEVQLPLVKYLHPSAKALYVRVAPSTVAIDLGKALFNAASELGKTITVVGSTDLTHYGAGFGFTPKGIGKNAEEWVRQENDKKIVDSFVTMDANAALEHAKNDRSACSAGAAAAAIAYAGASGTKKGELLTYKTSYEINPDDSFVGYASVIYKQR